MDHLFVLIVKDGTPTALYGPFDKAQAEDVFHRVVATGKSLTECSGHFIEGDLGVHIIASREFIQFEVQDGRVLHDDDLLGEFLDGRFVSSELLHGKDAEFQVRAEEFAQEVLEQARREQMRHPGFAFWFCGYQVRGRTWLLLVASAFLIFELVSWITKS